MGRVGVSVLQMSPEQVATAQSTLQQLWSGRGDDFSAGYSAVVLRRSVRGGRLGKLQQRCLCPLTHTVFCLFPLQ